MKSFLVLSFLQVFFFTTAQGQVCSSKWLDQSKAKVAVFAVCESESKAKGYNHLAQWLAEQDRYCQQSASFSKEPDFINACYKSVLDHANDVLTCEQSPQRFAEVAEIDTKITEDIWRKNGGAPAPTDIQKDFEALVTVAEKNFEFPQNMHPQWKLVVYNSADRNAHAAVGGQIIVSNGFWKGENAFEPDEVMAIMAHEFVHVIRKHYLKQGCLAVQWSDEKKTMKDAFNDMFEDFSPSDIRGKNWVQVSVGNELEADMMATTLLRLAGKNPGLMLKALTKLKPKVGGMPSISHPEFDERISRLQGI